MPIREEHAGLRRVAALVSSAAPEAILSAVTEELARIADPETGVTRRELAAVVRYEPDATVTIVGWCGPQPDPPPRTSRFPLTGRSVLAEVHRTGRPARVDGYGEAPDMIAGVARELGIVSSVAVPITIDDRLWGAVSVHSLHGPLPEGIEARTEAFAEVATTAIAVADARVEARRLADEQAALRRVATLAARDVPEGELFAAVAEEVGRLFAADATNVLRYEPDGMVMIVAAWAPRGARQEVGSRWPLIEGGAAAEIWRTGRSARVERWSDLAGEPAEHMYDVLGIRTSVGGPIRVDGRLWGALSAHSTGPWPLAPEAATRITDFAELVATAISNAHARTEARRLADEQAALRRVATLVARQAEPAEIFTTVAEEVTRVLPVDDAWVIRYEPGETATIVGGWGRLRGKLLLGSSLDLEGDSVSARVYRTQQPVRAELAQAGGNLAAYVRSLGVGLSIGTPILVDRRLWGAMIAAWRDPEQAAPGIESRILEFTELVATAVANVEARAALAASRERILLATDEARRRFERDLHDGAQQRLVALGAELRATAERAPPDKRGQLSGVADGIVAVIDELRELSRGLHPSILSEGGLRPALLALARRSAVTVRLDAELEGRFEERVEVAAYYVVSEALTNAAKHADATIVDIHVAAAEGLLAITIRDDGAGGADPSRGSGLLGLIDRVEALGGRAEIESPPGAGTSIHVQLPG